MALGMIEGFLIAAFFALVIGLSVRALFANRRSPSRAPYPGDPSAYSADPYYGDTSSSMFTPDSNDPGCADSGSFDGGSSDAGSCDGGGSSGE
jgi:hypothetical protein